MKERFEKQDFFKTRDFCDAKAIVRKMKTLAIDWEKICANDTSDKGLVSKRYKKFVKLSSKNTNHPTYKGAGDLHRDVTKENTHAASKCMEPRHLSPGKRRSNHNGAPPHTHWDDPK